MSTVTFGNLFESIGIAGWEHLEVPLFCALKTRVPVNLIGDKGTSKTTSVERLAIAIQGKNCRFQKYDTPDVSLDQVLGFLNLKKMEEGIVDFVKTGTSIWNKTFVLWDELPRVGPMMQGKLMEVIRTGRIHDIKSDVVFQFATSNPPRDTKTSVGHDTHFLGDALASRFFHLHVPRVDVAKFDKIMSLRNVGRAYEEQDSAKIAAASAPIQNIWMEFSRAVPSEDECNNAYKLVRALLADGKMNYIDGRTLVRTSDMLAELFCLARVVPASRSSLIDNIVAVIVGNIAELNGIVRNDKSSDLNMITAIIKPMAQSIAMNTKSDVSNKIRTMPFMMIQNGNFDDTTISEYLRILNQEPTQANITGGISSLFRKLPANNKYRAPAYRVGHKHAIAKLLDFARMQNITVVHVSMFDGITEDVDVTGSDYAKIAEALHNTWYKACNL